MAWGRINQMGRDMCPRVKRRFAPALCLFSRSGCSILQKVKTAAERAQAASCSTLEGGGLRRTSGSLEYESPPKLA